MNPEQIRKICEKIGVLEGDIDKLIERIEKQNNTPAKGKGQEGVQ
jgi:hypothetical protein